MNKIEWTGIANNISAYTKNYNDIEDEYFDGHQTIAYLNNASNPNINKKVKVTIEILGDEK